MNFVFSGRVSAHSSFRSVQQHGDSRGTQAVLLGGKGLVCPISEDLQERGSISKSHLSKSNRAWPRLLHLSPCSHTWAKGEAPQAWSHGSSQQPAQQGSVPPAGQARAGGQRYRARPSARWTRPGRWWPPTLCVSGRLSYSCAACWAERSQLCLLAKFSMKSSRAKGAPGTVRLWPCFLSGCGNLSSLGPALSPRSAHAGRRARGQPLFPDKVLPLASLPSAWG